MLLRRQMRENGGFTLIELLVVIAILGILMAIVVPTFLNQQGKAKDAAAQTRLATAAHALKGLWVSNGHQLPGDIADQLAESEPELTPIGTDNSLCDADTITVDVLGDDDVNIQTASATGQCFLYAAHFRGQDQRLKSEGSSETPINMAEDPSFEYDDVGGPPTPEWQYWASGDLDLNHIVVDDADAHTGSKSLRVYAGPNESDAGAEIGFIGDSQQTYTCSVYVKAVPGNAGASMRLDYDVNGDNIGFHVTASKHFTLTNSWQRVVVSDTNPTQIDSNACGVHPVDGDQPAVSFWIDSMLITTGPVAVPYFDGDNGGSWIGIDGKSPSTGTATQAWVPW